MSSEILYLEDKLDRRRTWSPRSFEVVMNCELKNLSSMKYFQSNENIGKFLSNPPILAPISGKYLPHSSTVVRPIAFKPVTSPLKNIELENHNSSQSPSDSGFVTDLEALLKERESEIMQLRKTMVLNETAILKVYEEKSLHWKTRLEQERHEWQSRLKDISRRARKIEEDLLERLADLSMENQTLRNQLNSKKNDVACQTDNNFFQDLNNEIDNLTNVFEREKRQWITEKQQVVRYHKCLEMNYKQMQKKNDELTQELAQLAVELEHRDLELENSI